MWGQFSGICRLPWAQAHQEAHDCIYASGEVPHSVDLCSPPMLLSAVMASKVPNLRHSYAVRPAIELLDRVLLVADRVVLVLLVIERGGCSSLPAALSVSETEAGHQTFSSANTVKLQCEASARGCGMWPVGVVVQKRQKQHGRVEASCQIAFAASFPGAAALLLPRDIVKL